MSHPRSTLHDVGESLFGAKWQKPLADRLGVSPRTMRRWASGDKPMPDNVRREVTGLLIERSDRQHEVFKAWCQARLMLS